MPGQVRFSFGPWNIHEGADPFGPEVRANIPFNRKLAFYKKLGFAGVQLHDDDAVPALDKLSSSQLVKQARTLGKRLWRSMDWRRNLWRPGYGWISEPWTAVTPPTMPLADVMPLNGAVGRLISPMRSEQS